MDAQITEEVAAGALSEELELGAPIARGGMGVIHLARQQSLDREVAAKVVRPGLDMAHELSLMREAVVTGMLEHPNIVPVYGLRMTGDGPVMVMKRIEGVRWTRLLREPGAVDAHLEGRTPLELHLDVLEAVCRAVHFAHSRGVVHRDLKPDNVMIGDHGDVYLLDWGLAVSVELGAGEALVPARQISAPAGSPAYMAPEMARGDGAQIGVHSDVYMLGAILYEVLTGRARNAGATVAAALVSAARGQPPVLLETAPPELARLVVEATAAAPDDRMDSAEAFRRALVDFRRHQHSERLTDAGDERRDNLCAEVRVLTHRAGVERWGDGPPPTLSLAPEEALGLRALLTEARLSYRQALGSWPENPRASDGLQTLLVAGVKLELLARNADAADALLSELPSPRADLGLALAALRQDALERAQERVRLDALAANLDPRPQAARRAGAGCLGGVFMFVATGSLAVLQRAGLVEVRVGHMLVAVLVFDVLALAASLAAGRLMPLSQTGVRDLRILQALCACVTALWAVAWFAGLDPSLGVALHCLVAAAVLTSFGFTVDVLALAGAGSLYLGTGAVLVWPAFHLELFALVNGLSWFSYAAASASYARKGA